MSEQKNTSEDDDPVRKKLRNLPKHQAPWYLEARLQQHLRGGEKSGNWFTTRPQPAYAWSLGVFLSIFIVGYYLLIVPIGIGFLSHAYRHFFVEPLELP